MTAQELITKSLEAYGASEKIITDFEKEKDNGVGSFAKKATPEKVGEVQAHLDEGDRYKLQADVLDRSDRLRKESEELRKNPLRKFQFGVDDENVAARMDYFKNFGLNTTALKLDDPRFQTHKMPREILGPPTDEMRSAFESYLRFGMRMLTDAERHALTPLTDAEGGYLVNQEYRTEIIRKLRNQVYMEERATVIDTSAGSVAFPTLDIADTQAILNQTLPNAGIGQAAITNWLGKTAFTPHSRKVIVPVPIELLEDAVIAVDGLLTDWFVMRAAEIKENDYQLGTGVNAPYGLFGPKGAGFPDAQVQAIEGSATAMVPEDVVNTVYALRAVYRKNASWMMHRSVINKIRLFRTNIGGAGTGNFMWQPSVQAGQPPTLEGYAVLESEFSPNPYTGALAAAGCAMAMFGDLKFYWIVRRIDLMVQRLIELLAGNGQVGFLFRMRYDAAPVLSDPFVFMTRN